MSGAPSEPPWFSAMQLALDDALRKRANPELWRILTGHDDYRAWCTRWGLDPAITQLFVRGVPVMPYAGWAECPRVMSAAEAEERVRR